MVLCVYTRRKASKGSQLSIIHSLHVMQDSLGEHALCSPLCFQSIKMLFSWVFSCHLTSLLGYFSLSASHKGQIKRPHQNEQTEMGFCVEDRRSKCKTKWTRHDKSGLLLPLMMEQVHYFERNIKCERMTRPQVHTSPLHHLLQHTVTLVLYWLTIFLVPLMSCSCFSSMAAQFQARMPIHICLWSLLFHQAHIYCFTTGCSAKQWFASATKGKQLLAIKLSSQELFMK